MGYPPPCQPPLVAAGSSSPSSAPKSIFQIVDALLPRRLLPSGRVSVRFPPKWLAPRVVSIRASRRSPSSLPVAVSRIPTEVSCLIRRVARFLKRAPDSVSTWRSVSTCFRRSRWRGYRPWRPFPVLLPEGCFPGSVSPCRYL